MDPALDRQGRRRLRADAHLGPRRLGAAAGVPTHQRARLDGLLRAAGAHRRRHGAGAGRRGRTPRATTRSSRASGPTSTRASSAGTASTARRTATPFVQTAQILPLAFGLVPDELRAAVATPARRRHREEPGTATRTWASSARADVLPVLTRDRPPRRGASRWPRRRASRAGATGPTWPASPRSASTGRRRRARATTTSSGRSCEWFYESLAGIRPAEPGYALSTSRRRSPRRASTTSRPRTRACAGPWPALAAHRRRARARRDGAAERAGAASTCRHRGPQAVSEPGEGTQRAGRAGRRSVKLVGSEGRQSCTRSAPAATGSGSPMCAEEGGGPSAHGRSRPGWYEFPFDIEPHLVQSTNH